MMVPILKVPAIEQIVAMRISGLKKFNPEGAKDTINWIKKYDDGNNINSITNSIAINSMYNYVRC